MCYKKWGGVVGNFFGHMRRTTLNRYCMSRSGGNFVGNEEVVYSVTLCTAMKQEKCQGQPPPIKEPLPGERQRDSVF